MQTDATDKPKVSSARVRFGIILWVASYIPIAIPISDKLHSSGVLPSSKSVTVFIAVVWGFQILIGLVGLYIAGQEAISMVKEDGLKKLPKNLWLVIIGRSKQVK
jgi:hypothetical protein